MKYDISDFLKDDYDEDDLDDWTEIEDDDFWEELADDMNEEGYNSSTGEYHWAEMSYNRIPAKTNFFEYQTEETE